MDPQVPPPPLPEFSTPDSGQEKKQKIAAICMAGFFFAVCLLAFGVLLAKRSNAPQEKYTSKQTAAQSQQSSTANKTTANTPEQLVSDKSATPPASTPPPSTSNSSSDRYLQIPEWGIKLKYTVAGDYTLTYSLIDSSTLYLSTEELAKFAKAHSECPDAIKGTTLNRIKPGGYDSQSGQQWDESRLQSVLAVKVHGYYYVQFNNDVCSTGSTGASFDLQQEFIGLDSKIPFNDAVSGL